MRIVDVVPNDHSNETNADGEPSIAVNPNNPREMVITAFTPPDGGNSNGPLFYSTDGGENWSLKFDIPGGMPLDQSPCFARTSDEMYLGALKGANQDLEVLRTTDPATGNVVVVETRPPVDQPWVEATTVVGGSDNGKDRVYVGYNSDGARSATLDVCLDAAVASPSINQVTLDPRSPSPNNGYEIRPAIHSDGTVYVAYQSRSSFDSTGHSVTDIVVARDDSWGAGGSPFTALTDPGDGKAGRLVAIGVPINEGTLGGVRLNNDLNIAVDPSNSDVVYIVWCDNAGPNYTLRVRRSLNRGVDWSGDLLVVDTAALATMRINGAGTVGLFYQQLVGGLMETHFRTTGDGVNWDDTLLARTATTTSFAGDYARLVCVGADFYGVFPAMNTPDPANFFPNGGGTFRFQRNTNGTQLRGSDGTTVVAASLDPFFFKVIERDCTIITDRSTFGKDEVDALLHLASPALIGAAFYVAIDGFPANELGITAATFSGTPDVVPTVVFSPPLNGMRVQATACSAPDETNLNIPQRFTWTFEVIVSDDSDFTGENVPITMTASITSTDSITVSGQAVITLTTEPNPYEVDGPTSWLSVDLQVFNVLQGAHLPSTPGIVLDSGPNDFIHRLLANTAGGYNDPGLARAPSHPFDVDLVANEDHSSVDIAKAVGAVPPFFPGIPIYNFAVARVRYRAISTPAPNVRVFFRMFQASTTAMDFQPTTTFATGGLGGSKVPLLGVVNGEVVTIPFFAAPRVDPSNPAGLNAQTDPDNVGPVGESIPPDGSGNEVQVYFGCWLDINQTEAVLPPASNTSAAGPYTPAQSIQQAIRGKHQCLVAEINLDPPEPQITTGATPAVSDKMAQRNLTIVGVASPHRVPLTFDIKPTRLTLPKGQTPDELMIDWSQVPSGSNASIYLPGTSAKTILQMADRMYTRHGLSSSDAHTLTCAARGITYVPIPPGVGSNYAGLLTLDLPGTVHRDRSFKVLTRQLTNVFAKRPTPPPPPPSIGLRVASRAAVTGASAKDLIEWRRVLGSFQLSIPVSTREALLGPEERLLSVLRWIAESIPKDNRWFPVFRRYLQQIAGRVSALGGDPSKILPSPSGAGGTESRPPDKHPEARLCLTGKVAGLIFDRFGDFDGFLLDTEDGERKFLSRETHIAELARRAWHERLRVTVCVEHHEPHRPEAIIVREPPMPFDG
jgi:hypothetical protein